MNISFRRKPYVFIFGTGGHSASITQVVIDLGMQIRAFVDIDPNRIQKEVPTIPVISESDFYSRYNGEAVVIGVGGNSVRQRIATELANNSIDNFPTIIHPTCYIPRACDLASGTIAFPHSKVGCFSKVGRFSILNTGSLMDHQNHIGDFVSVSTGAILAGGITLKNIVFIGAGVTISNDISIGERSIIGAGSTVLTDLPSDVLAVGSPCRVVKAVND